VKALLLSIYLTILFATSSPFPALAANLANGAKLFNANCSACHMGGNNVIISSKTLKKEALDKYGMASLDAITTQVTNGKNAMPSFRSRLNNGQIEDIANYVITQSQKGW
jgi:cytochrome c6